MKQWLCSNQYVKHIRDSALSHSPVWCCMPACLWEVYYSLSHGLNGNQHRADKKICIIPKLFEFSWRFTDLYFFFFFCFIFFLPFFLFSFSFIFFFSLLFTIWFVMFLFSVTSKKELPWIFLNHDSTWVYWTAKIRTTLLWTTPLLMLWPCTFPTGHRSSSPLSTFQWITFQDHCLVLANR